MNIQLTLAARYLRGRKLRTALTTLAIFFGVLVLFGMNTLLPAFTRAFQGNILAAAGQVDATVTLKTGDAFDAAVADRVAGVEGVRAVSRLLDRTINLPVDYLDNDPALPDPATALSLVGLDVAQATALHAYQVSDGRFLEAGDTDATVISRSLAELLGLGVGDGLTLPTPTGEQTLTIVGLLPPRTQLGDEEVLVTLPQAQAMLAMPGLINAVETNFEPVNEAERAAVEDAILAELGDTFQLGALSSNIELLANLTVAQGIFTLLGVLALLMGGFIIFNTFRTVVTERRRDIGMLRTLGASRRTILGTFLAEGLIQGVVGTALGLLGGYGLGWLGVTALAPLMSRMIHLDIGAPVVSPALVIGSVIVGVGVRLVSGMSSSWPMRNTLSRLMPLAAAMRSAGTSYLTAIEPNVSPWATTCTTCTGAGVPGVSVTPAVASAVASDAAESDGAAVSIGSGVAVAVAVAGGASA